MIVLALRGFHGCKVHKAWHWTCIWNALRKTGFSTMGSNAFWSPQGFMVWRPYKHRYIVTVHTVDLNWVGCYKMVSKVEQSCPRWRKEMNIHNRVEVNKWILWPRRRKEMNNYAHIKKKKLYPRRRKEMEQLSPCKTNK